MSIATAPAPAPTTAPPDPQALTSAHRRIYRACRDLIAQSIVPTGTIIAAQLGGLDARYCLKVRALLIRRGYLAQHEVSPEPGGLAPCGYCGTTQGRADAATGLPFRYRAWRIGCKPVCHACHLKEVAKERAAQKAILAAERRADGLGQHIVEDDHEPLTYQHMQQMVATKARDIREANETPIRDATDADAARLKALRSSARPEPSWQELAAAAVRDYRRSADRLGLGWGRVNEVLVMPMPEGTLAP